ncbi:MAG: Tat pathway signal protein [Sphingomonas sp. 28-66-16]|nr:MAG: Tat pathway signal protein [Sphingomonas sp. 28-66-16]
MISRRTLLMTGAAAGSIAALPAFARAPDDAGTRLAALFDAMFQDQLERNPEGATQLGLDKGANAGLRAKMSDQGEAGRAAARATTQAELEQLAAIDRTALSAGDRVNYDTVRYTRESAARVQTFDFGGSAYGPSPYVISQQSGAYQSVPNFLDTKHPIGTASDADAYLARLAAFGDQLEANTDRLRHDVGAGVLPPDFLLDKTLTQMRALRVPADQALVVTSIARRAKARGLDDRYGADAAKIYAERVLPALDRQIAAVESVRAVATHDAGVWKFRQGDAYYAVALANTTTTRLSPEEVHRFGLDQAKLIGDRMNALMVKAGMTKGSVGARLAAIYELPGQIFPNTDAGKAAAIDYCNGRLAAIRKELPRVFKRMPPYQFEVRRVPKDIEAGAASAFSQAPAIDGSRPGLVYFNLQDSAEWPKFMLDTVIYHEGLPGHQFEGGLALSNTGLPLIRKTGGFSGYGEGWALYAEQLADELGMYEGDPLGQIGYLKEALFRAHRCIIDTGLHHYKWSREKAMALFIDGQGEAPGFAEREIDRYCGSPGQACSYKLGHATFVTLRAKAEKALGAKYDIKDFHEAVLGSGRVPLEILEQVGNEWIAARAVA